MRSCCERWPSDRQAKRVFIYNSLIFLQPTDVSIDNGGLAYNLSITNGGSNHIPLLPLELFHMRISIDLSDL